jgi:hypothetical protein
MNMKEFKILCLNNNIVKENTYCGIESHIISQLIIIKYILNTKIDVIFYNFS